MQCITLVSDLGTEDASIASVKGILMQYAPEFKMVDISHSIAPFHLPQAAYVLGASYRHFPEGSFHIVLVDIFSEKNTSLVLCQKEGHYFLVPDNGVISFALKAGIEKTSLLYQSEISDHVHDWVHRCGTLIKSFKENRDAENLLTDYVLKPTPEHWQPKISDSSLECHVIHIDRFGNVVLNITKEEFEAARKGRPFTIRFVHSESVHAITQQYSGVRGGTNLCRFNSGGYLEIAVNKGAAAALFGLKLTMDKHTIYNTFHIYFE